MTAMTQMGDGGQLMQPPTFPPAPDPVAAHWQRQTDLQHLKLLSIFYYIFAGLQAIGFCGGLFYVFIGAAMSAVPPPASTNPQAEPPPEFIGGIMMVVGGCIGVLCLAWAGLTVTAGLSLARQQRRMLCLIVAGVACLSVPLGTILGVFTFIVLSRPSVIALFEEKRLAPAQNV